MDAYEEAVLFTLAALESRLDRLEYCLSGLEEDENEIGEKPKTLQERMQRLERILQELSARTALVRDVEELTSKYADLLKQQPEKSAQDGPELSMTEKAALVTHRAPAFATTASQLKALEDQQIPSIEGFTKLVKLRPRIAEAEKRQLEQAFKIAELRRRSGLLTLRRNHIHKVGQARCWKEWTARYQAAELTVKRAEFKIKQQEEEQG